MNFNFAPAYQYRILWYFFAFALGCAIYFGISFEPNLYCILSIMCCFGVLFLWRRWYYIGLCFFVMFGVCVASIRTHMITTPMLSSPLWRQTISGFVVDHVSLPDRQIITLDRVWGKMPQIPNQVRLTLYDSDPMIATGDWVKVQAHLFPPGNMMTQRMFFQGIGATGKILRVFKIRSKSLSWIDKIRASMIDRIKAQLPYSSEQIAIPLVTGEQRVVSKQMYDIYRKAGIAHVLSVSGFHMALLAGFIFFLIRGLLCCVPCIALRVNPKKIAAIIALGITFLYLLLSGVQIPALRSFLMIGIVLLGVLLDRRAFSLYTLLLIGFCMLCIRPEWIMSISFQLSFMAMLGLVSLFSQVNMKLKPYKKLHFIWMLMGANLLIELLLMPYVMYHFNQVNPYGVLGNLTVSFLFSFFVMPLLFIACVMMPFGWDIPFLQGAGWILDHISEVCLWIGQLPYADILVPSFSGMGLWIVSLGLGVLCLAQNKLRFAGIGIVGLGLLVGYAYMDRPDLLIADGGKTVLVRGPDNYLYSNQKDVNNWNLKRWLKENGQKEVLPLADNTITLANKQIVLSDKKCHQADLLIVSGKKQKCIGIKTFNPKKYTNYELFVNKGIFIQQENATMANRLWFQQGENK